MTPRVGSANSKTRDVVLDAAQDLMVADGYAGVSYRNVAAAAGVTPALVQYYFPRLDELFVALLRRGTDLAVEQVRQAHGSDQPLRTLWRYARDETGARLVMEFLALGRHRSSIGDEIGRGGELVRRAQVEAVGARWGDYGSAVHPFTPESLVFAMGAVARMVVLEQAFGMATGHEDTVRAIEQLLDRVEPKAARRATKEGAMRRGVLT